MKNDNQHIFLYMDDSGKISKYEDYAIFAGIVFTDNNEKSEFVNKYKSIYEKIKCKYCPYNHNVCDSSDCPEVKGSTIKTKDRRRIIQLSKKFTTFGTVIYNRNLRQDIVNRPASKGRFIEYSQRRLIKTTLVKLINDKIINPNKPVILHINIDEMPTKTNGYYTLEEGLYEELKNGIINFNYGKTFKPILYGKLKVRVKYKNSKYDYGIQMADIIANSIRRTLIFNNNWFSAKKYIKNKLKINVLLRLPN